MCNYTTLHGFGALPLEHKNSVNKAVTHRPLFDGTYLQKSGQWPQSPFKYARLGQQSGHPQTLDSVDYLWINRTPPWATELAQQSPTGTWQFLII